MSSPILAAGTGSCSFILGSNKDRHRWDTLNMAPYGQRNRTSLIWFSFNKMEISDKQKVWKIRSITQLKMWKGRLEDCRCLISLGGVAQHQKQKGLWHNAPNLPACFGRETGARTRQCSPKFDLKDVDIEAFWTKVIAVDASYMCVHMFVSACEHFGSMTSGIKIHLGLPLTTDKWLTA